MSQYKLTYFDIRGVAEPCRLIFAYKGVKYEDIRIPMGSLTPEKKQELNLPWGQVPILEVDGKRLFQSRTMMMYLGKKYNLVGKNDWEEAMVNEVVDAFLLDFAEKWSPAFREPDAKKKEAVLKQLVEVDTPDFLKKADKRLGENGTGFYVGNSLTVADIFAVHFITHFEHCFDLKLTTGFENIERLVKTVHETKGIKEWIMSRPNTKW